MFRENSLHRTSSRRLLFAGVGCDFTMNHESSAHADVIILFCLLLNHVVWQCDGLNLLREDHFEAKGQHCSLEEPSQSV